MLPHFSHIFTTMIYTIHTFSSVLHLPCIINIIQRNQINTFCSTLCKNPLKSIPKLRFLVHGVLDFEFERKKLSPQVTTDSDTVFHEESIGEGFKIVTVAVFGKILLFEKKLVRL